MSGIIGQAGTRSGIISHGGIDYEEGTFSPVPFAGVTDINYGSTGKYVKIGKLVNIFASVNSYRASNTGQFTVQSLPFTADSTGGMTALTFRGNDNVNTLKLSGSIGGNETKLYLYDEPHSTSSGLGGMTAEACLGTANTAFVLQATYRIK